MTDNTRFRLGIPGISLVFIAILAIAACGTDSSGATPTEELAACRDLSSTTPPAIFTPGPAPEHGLNSRERFLLTSSDDGASLLPYIEASGAKTDYRVVVSEGSSDTRSPSLSVTGRVSENDTVFIEELRFKLDDEFLEFMTEEDVESLNRINSLQMINVGETVYARTAGYEKWIEVSDIIGTPQDDRSGIWLIGSDDGQPEHLLCDTLFDQAVSVIDPQEIAETEAEGESVQAMAFTESRDEDNQVRIEHESTLELTEGFAEKTVDISVFFIAGRDDKLITRSVREVKTKISAFGTTDEQTEITEVTIEYGDQDFEIPSAENGTLETDPEVISEFQKIFE